MSRKLHIDVGWLWGGYLGRAVVYLGLTVVLTRALGAGRFGELSLFLAVALGVLQISGTWPFLAVPVLSAHGRTIGAAFRPAARVAGLATAGALLVALPVSYVIQSRAPLSLLALLCYGAALVGLQGIYSVLQTEGRMSSIALLQTAERGAALLLALIVVGLASLSVLGAEALLASAALGTCVWAYATVGRRAGLFRGGGEEMPDHPVATVMHEVGVMGIASVCAYGVAWADIFILAAFKSNADVGAYSLAYQVFTFVLQLGSLWAVAALPAHARSTAAGDSLRQQLPQRQLVSAAAFGAVLVTAIAVGSSIVLPHLFGAQFKEAFPPLMILLAGGGICGIGYFLVQPALIGSGKAVLLAKVGVVSVAINIGLDLALVPQIGVIGPAVATVAQTLFATACLTVMVLGWRAALTIFAVGLPAVAGVSLLAFDPGRGVFQLIAALLGLASGALAVAARRTTAAPAEVGSIVAEAPHG